MLKDFFKLFSPTPSPAEQIKSAASFIHSIRALLGKIPPSPQAETDPQLKRFEDYRDDLFKSYATIATHNPQKAIQVLLELGKTLHPNAQTSFWSTINTHVPKSLQDASNDTKEKAYKYILNHGHKGKISSFILSNADDFRALISTKHNKQDTDFIGTFLSHTAPNTVEFLETFKEDFQSFYDHSTADNKLALTKKLFKACAPINGKDKCITPPAYVEDMRIEQIHALLKQIKGLHNSGNDSGYKRTTNCLQDLETLKVSDTNLIGRAKSDKTDKGDHSLRLYKIDHASQSGDALYILAKKEKGYGLPTDSGKISTILSTDNLSMVTKAFATLPFNKDTQNTVAKLTAQFAPASTLDFSSYSMTSPYNNTLPQTTFKTASLETSFKAVSQLTVGSIGVNSPYAQPTQHRDILPLQHSQPREIQ